MTLRLEKIWILVSLKQKPDSESGPPVLRSAGNLNRKIDILLLHLFSSWFLAFLSSGELRWCRTDPALERTGVLPFPTCPGTVSLPWSSSPPGLQLPQPGTWPGGVTLAGCKCRAGVTAGAHSVPVVTKAILTVAFVVQPHSYFHTKIKIKTKVLYVEINANQSPKHT